MGQGSTEAGVGPDAVGVSVPATSANLGPGFDALAVATALPLHVTTARTGGPRVVAEGDGSAELSAGDDNLVWQAMCAYGERFGAQVPDVGLWARSAIPLQAGMGSSAAAAVAGVVLARALTGAGGSDAELIGLVAGLEGHGDNAAAALLGGLVVYLDGHAVRFDPADRLRPVLCVPAERQSTVASRQQLPDSVSLTSAAANGARTSLALAGLTGAAVWSPQALVDALAEPSRLEAAPRTRLLVETLRARGLGACLSGSGPSVLVVLAADDAEGLHTVHTEAGHDWRVVETAWDRAGATVCPPDR
jgi:homoserine kinase